MKWTAKCSRSHCPLDGWYIITPFLAAEIFENKAKNRAVKEGHVQRMVADIQSKMWRPNGEPLIFNEDMELSDGQNRIRAIIVANIPAECYCIFQIPKKYFPTFDTGVPRQGTDIAHILGFTSCNAVAATARLAIQYAEGTITKTGQSRFPNERLKQYMDKNREKLNEAVRFVNKHKTNLAKIIPISHAAFLYYETAEVHPKESGVFIERLSDGAGLERGSGILLLRDRMRELQGKKHHLTKVQKLALLIKVWRGFITGTPIYTLKFTPGEAFPRIKANGPGSTE